MEKRDKRGTDQILSIYWFLILFLVAGAVVYMAYVFYGKPLDVQPVESNLLANQVMSCVTAQGYLNDSIFTKSFQDNFLSDCHINFNVEDSYDWKTQQQYYIELQAYKFDPNIPGLAGNEIFNISVGNQNIKTSWQLESAQSSYSSQQRKVNTIIIHTTDGSDAASAIQTISQNGLSINYMIDRNGNIISSSNENQYASSQYANAFVPENQIAQDAGCNIGGTTIDSKVTTLPPCQKNCIDPNGLLDSNCQQLTGNLPQSQWCCIPNFNTYSIGIELVNLGPLCGDSNYKDSSYCKDAVSANGQEWENFSQAQIDSLVNLVSDISARYNIPLDRNHIIGHYEITTYKTDPGPAFPWNEFMQKLQERGAVSQSPSSSQGQYLHSAYIADSGGNQYVIKVLALIGKTQKNV